MNSVKLLDASGLAPENRITTSIMAQLLHHYSKESYYPTFFESLPSINGLRMKSGYIGGTRSYAGYIKMKDSTEACFAFIINDYTCKPKEVKLSMFQILDILK
jgi:D-alanyl-D-alanine carboxypeptidase/D-alanyl-D-alanine-endopeptidase (penicillin-binding protein 4)